MLGDLSRFAAATGRSKPCYPNVALWLHVGSSLADKIRVWILANDAVVVAITMVGGLLATKGANAVLSLGGIEAGR